MRPPTSALHPKSRFTTSLFATTVFFSFFVVALPHALPCPAPRTSYLDDGTPDPNTKRRRRRVVIVDESDSDAGAMPPPTAMTKGRDEDGNSSVVRDWNTRSTDGTTTTISKREKSKRACPVPKPGGLVGEILGFNNHPSQKEEGDAVSEKKEECPIPTPREMLGFKRVFPSSSRPSSRNSETSFLGRKTEGEGARPP